MKKYFLLLAGAVGLMSAMSYADTCFNYQTQINRLRAEETRLLNNNQVPAVSIAGFEAGYDGQVSHIINDLMVPLGCTATDPGVGPINPTCPEGTTGTPPNCVTNVNTCPAGTTGTYPNCVTTVNTCPAGTTGTYPNCVTTVNTCPAGTTGTYPNCVTTVNTCPAGTTGTYPNCVTTVNTCPAGTTGTYPNCVTNGDCTDGYHQVCVEQADRQVPCGPGARNAVGAQCHGTPTPTPPPHICWEHVDPICHMERCDATTGNNNPPSGDTNSQTCKDRYQAIIDQARAMVANHARPSAVAGYLSSQKEALKRSGCNYGQLRSGYEHDHHDCDGHH